MGKKVKMKMRICPVCGSRRLERASVFSGWLTPEVWFCPDCGYRGPVYGEIEVDPSELGGGGENSPRGGREGDR